MKSILSDEAAPVLDAVARERMLLAFDFDGTLAPLVESFPEARLPPATRALLRLASLLYPCAVISGRERQDIAWRLEGIPLVAVVGNYGAEPGRGPVDRTARGRVAEWCAAAAPRLAGVPGVELEPKGLSLAIHYRRAPASREAERAVAAVAAALPGGQVLRGSGVVNVVVPDLPHDKGAAVAEVLARLGRRRALYVGDDRSDEDAFGCPGVEVAVRVGDCAGSAAGWCVPAQPDVDELLRALIRARRRVDGQREQAAGLERALEW